MTKAEYVTYATDTCNLSIDSDIVGKICLSRKELTLLLEITLKSLLAINSDVYKKNSLVSSHSHPHEIKSTHYKSA